MYRSRMRRNSSAASAALRMGASAAKDCEDVARASVVLRSGRFMFSMCSSVGVPADWEPLMLTCFRFCNVVHVCTR